MRSSPMRVAILAPHFAEYSLRLACALALGHQAKVLVVVERKNLREEWSAALLQQARRSVEIISFDAWSRMGRMLAVGTVPLQIAAFQPHILFAGRGPGNAVNNSRSPPGEKIGCPPTRHRRACGSTQLGFESPFHQKYEQLRSGALLLALGRKNPLIGSVPTPLGRPTGGSACQ
jgi:hypothetical protein